MLSTRFYISPRSWKELTGKIPIPCVDTIVYRDDCVLLGWRTIPPYRNVWALIGGRMHYGESFVDTSIRHCRESGLRIEQTQYVGVFPIRFPMGRHDLAFCLAARYVSGDPKRTRELSECVWVRENQTDMMPDVGGNYLKMLRTWFHMRRERV